jgi:membrane associated rhomboid family serine protease
MIPLSDDELRPHTTPIVTFVLIFLNVWIFLTVSPEAADIYGVRVGDILGGTNLITLITSVFLHGGFLHILFNMWSLWIFGDNVEDDLGAFGYLFLYLVSGIAGGVVFALFAPDPNAIAIGASGAISGVMAAYLILHPRNRVLTLVPLGIIFTTIRIKAPIFIGLWFLLQFAGFALAGESGVAYSAHVGGFIAGLIIAFLLKPANPDTVYPPGQ